MKSILSFLLVLLTLTAQAQKMAVSGRVLGSKGEGIPGATVLEKGTNNGMATNSEGMFSLRAYPNRLKKERSCRAQRSISTASLTHF